MFQMYACFVLQPFMSGAAQHWREGGHKRFCIAIAERTLEAKPAPPETAKASSAVHKKNETDECSICKEALASLIISALPCGHTFHEECIVSLLEFGSSESCPLCRMPISSDNFGGKDQALRFSNVNRSGNGITNLLDASKTGDLCGAQKRE
jgi:hypothetical protein